MKNFLYLILGIIIGAALAYLYNTKDETDATVELKQVNLPQGIITPAEAMRLDKAYNIKHNIINDSLFKKDPNGGDNRSSWYALKDIESYLHYAKNQANELGYQLDGLRVYLGSYPKEDKQSGLTTMFFIPTGVKKIDEGSMFSLRQGSIDIPGGDGLNKGSNGNPPSENYPQ
ncbi:hypothetical protein [uncultured Winogradskyella sp.]|uniref:hypothetical protein n=1 Tax=uncultured Winogradskyella sp. TaxID=395353 RepID=UPI0035199C8A